MFPAHTSSKTSLLLMQKAPAKTVASTAEAPRRGSPSCKHHVSSPVTPFSSPWDAPGTGCFPPYTGREQYGALGCTVMLWGFSGKPLAKGCEGNMAT